jgi:hypothetical protein
LKINRKLAGLILAAAVLTGTAACGTGDGYHTEVEYGYYNSQHVFIYYATPHTVRVTNSYYHAHSSLFANPAHHTVSTTHTTTTTKTTKGGTSLTKGTKSTTTTRTRTTTTRSHH